MFDLTQDFGDDNSSAVPKGTYSSFVERAEFKTSGAGNEYLNLMFRITGPTQANRVVFSMYNISHPNDKVRNIALSGIKKLFLASGISEELLKSIDKQGMLKLCLDCRCDITLDTKTDDYGEKNIIKGYKLLSSEAPVVSSENIPF